MGLDFKWDLFCFLFSLLVRGADQKLRNGSPFLFLCVLFHGGDFNFPWTSHWSLNDGTLLISIFEDQRICEKSNPWELHQPSNCVCSQVVLVCISFHITYGKDWERKCPLGNGFTTYIFLSEEIISYGCSIFIRIPGWSKFEIFNFYPPSSKCFCQISVPVFELGFNWQLFCSV